MTRVGIVGAGISGLACAQRLSDHGIDVSLVDKGNRPGGRLASVTIDDMAWDIGAPHFTARQPEFFEQAERWRNAGWTASWSNGPSAAYVGVPSMAALVTRQCEFLDARFGALVQRIEREDESWYMTGSDFREGPFAAMVIAVPAEQAATLLSLHDLEWAGDVAAVRSTPCWSVMAAFTAPVASRESVLACDGVLASAVRNSSKPGRGAAECWVLQASAQWSRANLELPREDVAKLLLEEFGNELEYPMPGIIFAKAHRWRFALPFGLYGSSRWNHDQRLGACGDWCTGPTVEEAWLSGNDLGRQIVACFQAIAAQT
ncbi:NAD(P)-binding protein [Novosphingobium sp. PS1R-30]|uniref:NAD(P)-binding protein n=1 Tax=Novosphingobium anseongense TaxID=3133436 RepID=A0ABU8S3W6_9SPHN